MVILSRHSFPWWVHRRQALGLAGVNSGKEGSQKEECGSAPMANPMVELGRIGCNLGRSSISHQAISEFDSLRKSQNCKPVRDENSIASRSFASIIAVT